MKHYRFVDYATTAYAALAGALILLFHNDTVPNWQWLALASVAIIAVVHALIQWQARRPGNPVLDFIRFYYPILLYIWFFAETGWFNRMFFHEYLDPVAIRLDQAIFGCQPSLVFMNRLPYLAVSEIFYASYFSYYIMIGGVGMALYVRDRRQFFHYLSVVSFVFYICYTIYVVVPIIGPRVFFRDVAGYDLPAASQQLAGTPSFPASVQVGVFYHIMAFIYRVFEAPGAALPSSHVAVAWCTVYFSFKYLRAIRYPHMVVAVLLSLATVYCRYHYAVDVLAGALTAIVLIPVANWLFRRTEAGQKL